MVKQWRWCCFPLTSWTNKKEILCLSNPANKSEESITCWWRRCGVITSRCISRCQHVHFDMLLATLEPHMYPCLLKVFTCKFSQLCLKSKFVNTSLVKGTGVESSSLNNWPVHAHMRIKSHTCWLCLHVCTCWTVMCCPGYRLWLTAETFFRCSLLIASCSTWSMCVWVCNRCGADLFCRFLSFPSPPSLCPSSTLSFFPSCFFLTCHHVKTSCSGKTWNSPPSFSFRLYISFPMHVRDNMQSFC